MTASVSGGEDKRFTIITVGRREKQEKGRYIDMGGRKIMRIGSRSQLSPPPLDVMRREISWKRGQLFSFCLHPAHFFNTVLVVDTLVCYYGEP